MNYIQKLKRENEIMREYTDYIHSYLVSEKFNVDNMVNRNDILLRLREMENALNEIE